MQEKLAIAYEILKGEIRAQAGDSQHSQRSTTSSTTELDLEAHVLPAGTVRKTVSLLVHPLNFDFNRNSEAIQTG